MEIVHKIMHIVKIILVLISLIDGHLLYQIHNLRFRYITETPNPDNLRCKGGHNSQYCAYALMLFKLPSGWSPRPVVIH